MLKLKWIINRAIKCRQWVLFLIKRYNPCFTERQMFGEGSGGGCRLWRLKTAARLSNPEGLRVCEHVANVVFFISFQHCQNICKRVSFYWLQTLSEKLFVTCPHTRKPLPLVRYDGFPFLLASKNVSPTLFMNFNGSVMVWQRTSNFCSFDKN